MRFSAAQRLFAAHVLGSAASAFATNYYVKPAAAGGSNRHDGKSPERAWASINYAVNHRGVGPGDTIIVQDGTYPGRVNIPKSGNRSADLVVKAETPLGAVIDATDAAYAFLITGSYVKVDGFKVHHANQSGITIQRAHHVTVVNCESFHNRGAGIYGGGSDYLTIDRNHVYDNAWGAKIVTSGISIHLPINQTGDRQTTTPRILIRWNTVHDNHQGETFKNPTDGAGIILDDLRCAASTRHDTYEFPAVIEDNLTYHNGGPGIKLYSTRNVTVRNNTSFKNQKDHRTRTWRAEIQIINCDNVELVNNIAVTDLAGDPHRTPFGNLIQKNVTYTGDNENIVWKNNLLYNYDGPAQTNTNFAGASVPTAGPPDDNKIDVVPGFLNPVGPDYDFRLKSDSPARNAGTSALGYATEDLASNLRPQGAKIDLGCYEYVE